MVATHVNCVIRLIKLITSTQACNLWNHLCQDGQTCCQLEIQGYCYSNAVTVRWTMREHKYNRHMVLDL